MRTPRHLTTALLVALGACGNDTRRVTQAQVLLYFDTDAPVPVGPDRPAASTRPLFDRLRVDIYPPGESSPCPGCTSEFDIDDSIFGQRRASIGIAPSLATPGYRARARLFQRALASASGEPSVDATIDVTIALPAVDREAVSEITALLSTNDVGHPKGSLADPLKPLVGPPAQSAVGTWPGAQRIDCAGAPPPGAVCVPGGAYWIGTPNGAAFAPGRYFSEPRLIVLSPFFLSATEITVREFRASGKTPGILWSGHSTGLSSEDWCTFTTAPGNFEQFPVNCVSFAEAHEYCASMGGDLPTEAQYEYVAGALSGSLFPWGQDAPSCTDAIYGRAGYGLLAGLPTPCKPVQPPGSPAVPGSGARDRLDLPGGSIVDLAGNLSEWTRDLWNRIDEPCWARVGIYRDPWCTTVSPADGATIAVRGGTWAQVAAFLESHGRSPIGPTIATAATGFRCVWPGR